MPAIEDITNGSANPPVPAARATEPNVVAIDKPVVIFLVNSCLSLFFTS